DAPERDARARIEARGRLVQEEELRPVDDGAREHQPLLVAAAQGVRARVAVLAELEEVEQLVDARPEVGDARAKVARVDLEVLGDGEVVVQAVVLGTHADVALERLAVGDEVPSEEPDAPSVGLEEAVEHAERGRLAGAVRAEQAEHAPALAAQIEPVDGVTRAEPFHETFGDEERRLHDGGRSLAGPKGPPNLQMETAARPAAMGGSSSRRWRAAVS